MDNFNRWAIKLKGSTAYNGTPRHYKIMCRWVTTVLALWFYFGFTLTKMIFQNENWFGVWELPVSVIIVAILFYRYYYKVVMRLDGQYGKGSGWDLKETTVTLPSLKKHH